MNDRIKTTASCQDSSDSSLTMSAALTKISETVKPISGNHCVAFAGGIEARACHTGNLATECASASQLGDGRLRFAQQRPAVDGET